MSQTDFDDVTKYVIKQMTQPWAGKVDRKAAEGALNEHFEHLGLKPYPVRWASDGAYGYIDALSSGGVVLGMTNDATWLNQHKKIGAKARERIWHKRYIATTTEAMKAWTRDDDFVISRMIDNASRELGRNNVSVNRRGRGVVPTEAVVRRAAQGIAWSEMFAHTDDEVADELSRIWMPFVDMYEAGAWFCWIVNGEVILVERPRIYKDTRDRYHRVDGPAIDWNNGEGVFFWSGVEVDKQIVMHPERITTSMIDRERNIEVRRVLIERFGLDRYLADAEVVHKDARGTLLRKQVPNDEPIVVVRVRNSTAEPDGTFKDYFIRVPPHINNASHAVAWTFGIEPDEYYDPLLET